MALDEITLREELKEELVEEYGVLIGGEDLLKVLGYPSKNALRIAIHEKAISLPIFTLDKRRTKFALSKDVAAWLACQRFKNVINVENKEDA